MPFVRKFPIELLLMSGITWKQSIFHQALCTHVPSAMNSLILQFHSITIKPENTNRTICKRSFVPGELLTDPSQLNQFVKRNIEDGKYFCAICNSVFHKVVSIVRNHVEAVHFPASFTYACDICSESFNSRKSLYNHKARKHKHNIQ